MSFSRAFLVAIYLLILTKQFFSLSQSAPTISSTVEVLITTAIILIFFSGFRGEAFMQKMSAYIGIALGMFYIVSNFYLYIEGDTIIYTSFYVGLVQSVLGAAIVLRKPAPLLNEVKISYYMSVVPIGYIVLLAMHDPYPIEASVSMFGIQLLVSALLLFRIRQPEMKYIVFVKLLMLTVAALSFLYFILGIMNNLFIGAVEYCAYGVIVAWIVLKIEPYQAVDS